MKTKVCVSFLVTTTVFMAAACDGFDQTKFDRVYRAGKALEVEVHSTGGASPRSEVLQKEFETEVSALKGRAKGKRETDALQAFTEANDAYRYFIRFRFLDFDAVEGRILLMGTNLEVASRYRLPVEALGGHQWVNSSAALKILLETADRELTQANRVVNGQG